MDIKWDADDRWLINWYYTKKWTADIKTEFGYIGLVLEVDSWDCWCLSIFGSKIEVDELSLGIKATPQSHIPAKDKVSNIIDTVFVKNRDFFLNRLGRFTVKNLPEGKE